MGDVYFVDGAKPMEEGKRKYKMKIDRLYSGTYIIGDRCSLKSKSHNMAIEKTAIDRQKREGAHFTPPKLALFVADQLLKAKPVSPDGRISILDPSIGEGELIVALLSRIPVSRLSRVRVVGYDINVSSLQIASNRIRERFPQVSLAVSIKNFLKDEDDLFAEPDTFNHERFDYIIANPPYIRTQVLGTRESQKISQRWGLSGRVDVYQAFMLAVYDLMNDGCVAGFITSNRFMTIKGCGDFRKTLRKKYSFLSIWDFGDTALFKAAVLPVVTIFSRCSPKVHPPDFHSVYLSHERNENVVACVNDPIEAIQRSGKVKTKDGTCYIARSGELASVGADGVWALSDNTSSEWLSTVLSHTAYRFGAIGKIRVGVKTTADNVFIHDDWQGETGLNPELLLPLVTHKVASPFRRTETIKTKILYTHFTENGKKKAYDLSRYPISKQYLLANYEQLAARTYIAKSRRNWYEIWVPQDPALWSKLKIVFRDITEHPCFWIEDAPVVINGDCYWMTLDSEEFSEDILWLVLAVANSSFIEHFYDCCFNNKLYSNKRRFISQYVEQFPIPDPQADISKKIITKTKNIFHMGVKESEKQELDDLVCAAFGV